MSTAPQTKELDRRLRLAVAAPLVLMAAIGIALGLQIQRLVAEAEWVDHTDKIISFTNELAKQIVDQETGIRGFLLTKDRAFLEPYLRARPLAVVEEVRGLVIDNPRQVARVDALKARYERWLEMAKAVEQGEAMEESAELGTMRRRRNEMDFVRETIDGILTEERELLRARHAASDAALQRTKIVLLGVLGGFALVFALFSRRQLAAIAESFATALHKEQASRTTAERLAWQNAGQMQLSEALQGDLAMEELARRALDTLAPYVGAEIGALFTGDPVGWRRRAGFALDPRVAGPETFGKGEGLIGMTAERGTLVHLRDVPDDFLMLRAGTGARRPAEVVVLPARLDGRTLAVLELGFLRAVDARTIELIGRIGETLATAVRSADYKQTLRELLEESQQQAEELQAQQEELRVSNEELEEQTNAVRAAQADSEQRQRALEEINVRLEEQTQSLRAAQREVLARSADAERASRYKSEFLANMSHELRTPLNSTLILAKLLSDNAAGNLTPEQVQFAETISSAGNDLLNLINDVLDLSKIEAGKVDLTIEDVSLRASAEGLRRTFAPIAATKGLTLAIHVADDVPQALPTDAQRLEQILRNLLSNALKFTERGTVALEVSRLDTPTGPQVRFQVRDSGIGIADDQQVYIFEAFRQADGGTTRKYGGTGLGLSISRDLAKLLGGSIMVESALGKGSTFTLVLPVAGPRTAAPGPAPSVPAAIPSVATRVTSGPAFDDDRASLDREKRTVLIVEDDVAFAKILYDLSHELGYQAVIAHDADAGVALARESQPSAVLLDIRLPGHSGLSVLDRLKHDPRTRHLPVHVISTDDHAQVALSMGAEGYTRKPVDREQLIATFRKLEARLEKKVQHVLVVEDDDVQRDSLRRLLEGPGVEIVAVATVAEAQRVLAEGLIDCVVTDLTLPDASGFDLLERMGSDADHAPPVIVYTGRSLSTQEEQRLRKYSSSIIVKGARSPERLLDEVTLFLHQVEADLPIDRQRMLKHARDREAVFAGRHLLIVEDDVRNIFATTRVLEPKGMKVSIARNGREAIEALERTPDIDVVLMDIMMPEMDGIEAMQRIRARPEWQKLPIIALTAKAMRDDQERCLRAGASDYIPKPLDVEMLLSLLRVWLPK